MDWLQALGRLRADARPGVLATVIEVRGHGPREAGAKMVIAEEGTWDSIGGGNLEAEVVARARALIRDGAAAPETMTLALNDRVSGQYGRQCCGGEVRVLLEPLRADPTVAVFGVGHVGLELARILSRLRLRLQLVDSRADQLHPLRLAEVTGGVAAVTVHHAAAPEAVLRALPAGAQVLIMTHDHAEDFLLCDAALRRGDLTVGLIGSAAKWARFRKRLLAEGHPPTAVDAISCPVGLPGLTGKAPAVIAVSVAADLLQRLQPAQAPRTGRRPAAVAGSAPATAAGSPPAGDGPPQGAEA